MNADLQVIISDMKQTTPYVYRLTDRETGKRYIGSRYAIGCGPTDLGVKYFTSSGIVEPLFRADPDRFDKQIIVTGDFNYVIDVEKTLIDLYDAVQSDEFYNRTSGKAIHPADRRVGALKEHAKRSPEMYARIVVQMHSKTTKAQRSKASTDYANSIRGPKLDAKMEMMRASRTEEGKQKSLNAMLAANTKESLSFAGKIGGKAGGPKGCKITNSQRWKCVQCGMISLPGPIGKHQNRSGHTGKERIV